MTGIPEHIIRRLDRGSTTHSVDWTLETLIGAVGKGRVTAAPGLAYQAPWDAVGCSRFLESALLNLPLGQTVAVMTAAQGRTQELALVDGARRLAAICLFAGVAVPWAAAVETGYALTGLERLPELNGARWVDFVAAGSPHLENAGLRLALVDAADAPDPAALRRLVQG